MNIVLLIPYKSTCKRHIPYTLDSRLVAALQSKEFKIYRDYQFEINNKFDKMPRVYN